MGRQNVVTTNIRLADLPDNYPISLDTETSGLHVDFGARLAAASFSFRVPDANGKSQPDNPMVWKALPFDQGLANLPLGIKTLDEKTFKRISKWSDEAKTEDALNLNVVQYRAFTKQLQRLNIIWHNSKFDMHMFRTGLRDHEAETAVDLDDQFRWDTQLAQSVIDPLNGTSLKPTSVRLHLGQALGVKEGMEDDEALALKPWLGPRTGKNADPRYDLVPWSVMGPYARMDAALTLLLWEWQLAEIEGRNIEWHIQRENDLARVLYRMESRGIRYDVETSHRMADMIDAEREQVAKDMPFRVTPVEARKYFFGTGEGQLAHPVFSDKLTDKKRDPQVDDEVIDRLVKEDWKGRGAAQQYKLHESLKSANSKWYRAWADRAGQDNRLRVNYRQAHVVSGRLSAEWIQLQAIPHSYQMPKIAGLVPVRDLFFEDVECECGCGTMELWEFDISQAEIRIGTAIAQCRGMLEGFLRGDDSHSIACRLMFESIFVADGYAGREEQHPQWDQFRQIAKRCNLGIMFGAGAKVIKEQLLLFAGMDAPIGQVIGWIADWKRAFPEMGERLYIMERMAVTEGYVRLVNGRQRWFSPYEDVHKAFNQEVQGSLAEVMKELMIDTENRWPGRLLLQIHDSLVLRLSKCMVRTGVVDEVCDLMVKYYEEAFARRWDDTGEVVMVPFKSDAKQFGRKVVAA